MLFIAHRGNTAGPDPVSENTISYLKSAYDMGFGVECDIQLHNGDLYFGHDGPQELVDYKFIMQDNVFCHAKTVGTLSVLLNLGTNCFFHATDDVTLTGKGQIWCYPGQHPVSKNAIWLDLHDKPLPGNVEGIYGICGDISPSSSSSSSANLLSRGVG